MVKDIHELLKEFQELWDKSLNGDYSNREKLSSVAWKINEQEQCKLFEHSSLSNTEKMTLANSLIIANM